MSDADTVLQPAQPQATEEPQLISRPILIDTKRLKPIDIQEFVNSECFNCHKMQSKWALIPPEAAEEDDALAVCSYCFLYDSQWGQNRAAELGVYLTELEREINKTFVRDPLNRVASIKECDNILGAIALFSVMYEQRMAKIAEDVASTTKAEASKIILPYGPQFQVKE